MVKIRAAITGIGILAAALPAWSADVIVESRPGGKNFEGYSETRGRWLDSNTPADTAKSSAPGATPGIGSRKTTVQPEPGANPATLVSTARFTPKITEPGQYYVYLTFPRAANATPLSVLVKTSQGEQRKDITQDGWGAAGAPNGNEWLEIGQFPFTTAGGEFVELNVTGATGAADPGNQAQAYADAVRFSTEKISAATAPAPAVPGRPVSPATKAPEKAAGAVSSTSSAAPLAWQTDLAAARATAAAEKKQVLAFFASGESSRSTEYEKGVLNKPAVRAVIAEKYVPVKIDMESQKQLVSQLQVFRAGTINIYDGATGSFVAQIGDTPEADELVKRLNSAK